MGRIGRAQHRSEGCVRALPLPVRASRVMREWFWTALRIAAARSEGAEAASQKAAAKAADSGVAERMVSVRPCLKAAVEADSYVETERPCMRTWAS